MWKKYGKFASDFFKGLSLVAGSFISGYLVGFYIPAFPFPVAMILFVLFVTYVAKKNYERELN